MRRRLHSGQAVAESVLALGALAILFWAVPLIGRYQDIALESTHASRHAAFMETRVSDRAEAEQALRKHYFSGAGMRWRDTHGDPLLTGPAGLGLQRIASTADLQPAFNTGAHLYEDWRLDDTGILVATVSAKARNLVSQTNSLAQGVFTFRGHTAILTGAGHAADDADVQRRIASGHTGWAAAARQSRAAGERVAGSMQRVDAAWGRAGPQFDWLSAWASLVPEDRLTQRQGEP